ncbi:hypothetical protein ACTA71_002094 [Dictyostelium dimigraforme]
MEELFENDYFIIIGTVADKDSLTDSIDECGGIFSKTLNKKTTLIICNDIDDENNKKEFEKVKSDLKIIREQFITESIKEKKRLNIEDFITKSKSGSNDSDDQQPSKRLKVDSLQVGSTWMGALFYINTSESYPFSLNIESRVDDINANQSKLEGTIDWPTLEDAKTAFRAILKDDDLKIEEHTQITNTDQVSLPNNYEAKVINGNRPSIKGTIVYSDPADSANPELKASFNLTFKPSTTTSSISSSSISSSSTSSSSSSSSSTTNSTSTNGTGSPATSTTTTTTTPPPPKLDLDYLIAGNQFKGEFEIPYKSNIKITSRKNQQDIEGIVDWVDLKTKTKLKGTLNEKDLTITLTETDIISGSGVELPIVYTGTLTSSTNPTSTDPKHLDLIIGQYKVEAGTTSIGKFKMELNC